MRGATVTLIRRVRSILDIARGRGRGARRGTAAAVRAGHRGARIARAIHGPRSKARAARGRRSVGDRRMRDGHARDSAVAGGAAESSWAKCRRLDRVSAPSRRSSTAPRDRLDRDCRSTGARNRRDAGEARASGARVGGVFVKAGEEQTVAARSPGPRRCLALSPFIQCASRGGYFRSQVALSAEWWLRRRNGLR